VGLDFKYYNQKFFSGICGGAGEVILVIFTKFSNLKFPHLNKVDRLWSIIPVFFTWHFILHGCWTNACNLNARGVILGLLTTVWGARLTYNYARKGGYKWESEDYR
jgi:steroid 5-alpha reductase family enzyme